MTSRARASWARWTTFSMPRVLRSIDSSGLSTISWTPTAEARWKQASAPARARRTSPCSVTEPSMKRTEPSSSR